MAFFIVTPVKTSNLTYYHMCNIVHLLIPDFTLANIEQMFSASYNKHRIYVHIFHFLDYLIDGGFDVLTAMVSSMIVSMKFDITKIYTRKTMT
jgi:hypothetical protein